MQSKILIFDFDGTVADTSDAAIRIYNQIAAENNYKQITKDNLETLRNMGALKAIKYAGVPMWKLPFIVRKVRSAFKAEVPNIKPYDGVLDALRVLKSKGYSLYVISTNSRENIKAFLDRNGIKEFNDVFGVSNMFGKDAKIASMIKANNWDKAQVSYIGDEIRDIEAARKAGVTSVSVGWGYNTTEGLSKNGPDILLTKPSELGSL
jgi:phosphoglycolate phosphatase-like HAD superfamily hydrolase